MTETNTTRPTPEQIADQLTGAHRGDGIGRMCWPSSVLDALAAHGYVIVHPDDVPERDDPDSRREDWEDGWEVGWNACRAHIFGEGQ